MEGKRRGRGEDQDAETASGAAPRRAARPLGTNVAALLIALFGVVGLVAFMNLHIGTHVHREHGLTGMDAALKAAAEQSLVLRKRPSDPLLLLDSLEGPLQPNPPPSPPATPPALSAGPAGVNGTCGKLTRELLEPWAVNNTVMITFADALMVNMYGLSWLKNLQTAGINFWVLAVADDRTGSLAVSKGMGRCFLAQEMEVDNLDAAFKWGSKTWQLHTWQKVLTVRHVHQLGFNVLHSDIDVVWFRNPLPYFLEKYTFPDYMVSMDPITTRNPLGDDGPEVGITTSHYMNTGVYFLRQTPGGTALINKWYEIRKEMQDRGFHDQDGLYQYLTRVDHEEVDHARRATHVVNKTVWLAQLPATQFQNGYSHCINRVHKVHNLMPYETHFVWVWGNNKGKVMRMREQMYFWDPPEYYSEGLYLSADLEIIPTPAGFNELSDWRNDTEGMVQHHLRGLQQQLSEFYAILAVAKALGRILILPKIQCWCIQNWFENPLCRLPGDHMTRFPMTCPADFVFDMDKLAALPVQVREHSFLENLRTDEAVKGPPVLVKAVPGTAKPTLLPVEELGGEALRTVHMPPGSKETEIVAALQRLRHAKRIHLSNAKQLFGGFATDEARAAYEKQLEGLAVRWCCRPDMVARDHRKELHYHLTVTRDGRFEEGTKEWPPQEQQRRQSRSRGRASSRLQLR